MSPKPYELLVKVDRTEPIAPDLIGVRWNPHSFSYPIEVIVEDHDHVRVAYKLTGLGAQHFRDELAACIENVKPNPWRLLEELAEEYDVEGGGLSSDLVTRVDNALATWRKAPDVAESA